MYVGFCIFCVRVNASVVTQLGGCSKSRRYQELEGAFRYLSDHS